MNYKLLFIIPYLVWMLICQGFSAIGQIHTHDGLRMPGSWNGWANSQNMGGAFDFARITTGTLRWHTTFQHTGTTGVQEFKFVRLNLSGLSSGLYLLRFENDEGVITRKLIIR